MQTPTLTEARRALLEISQPEHAAYLTEQIALRLAVVGAYLDTQVPLESARQNVRDFLLMSNYHFGKLGPDRPNTPAGPQTFSPAYADIVANRNRILGKIPTMTDSAGFVHQSFGPEDMVAISNSGRSALASILNQPGINDIVTSGLKYTGSDVVNVDLGLSVKDSRTIGKS